MGILFGILRMQFDSCKISDGLFELQVIALCVYNVYIIQLFVECTLSLTDAIYFKTLPLWHSDIPLTVAHAESTYLNFAVKQSETKDRRTKQIWYFEIQNTLFSPSREITVSTCTEKAQKSSDNQPTMQCLVLITFLLKTAPQVSMSCSGCIPGSFLKTRGSVFRAVQYTVTVNIQQNRWAREFVFQLCKSKQI